MEDRTDTTGRDAIRFIDLGLIDYRSAQTIQRALLEKRIRNEVPDVVILCEHQPVVTIGRLGSMGSVRDPEALKEKNIDVVFADRGGGATYHCPGQIVLYPVIDLKPLKKDVHFYIRFLEDFAISFFRSCGLETGRVAGKSGVWTGAKKIASIGIGVRKWVTFHGISLNIDPDMAAFDLINICGDARDRMTSVGELLGIKPDTAGIKRKLRDGFLSSFGRCYASLDKTGARKEVFSE